MWSERIYPLKQFLKIYMCRLLSLPGIQMHEVQGLIRCKEGEQPKEKRFPKIEQDESKMNL